MLWAAPGRRMMMGGRNWQVEIEFAMRNTRMIECAGVLKVERRIWSMRILRIANWNTLGTLEALYTRLLNNNLESTQPRTERQGVSARNWWKWRNWHGKDEGIYGFHSARLELAYGVWCCQMTFSNLLFEHQGISFAIHFHIVCRYCFFSFFIALLICQQIQSTRSKQGRTQTVKSLAIPISVAILLFECNSKSICDIVWQAGGSEIANCSHLNIFRIRIRSTFPKSAKPFVECKSSQYATLSGRPQ